METQTQLTLLQVIADYGRPIIVCQGCRLLSLPACRSGLKVTPSSSPCSTAYGDVVAALVGNLNSPSGDHVASTTRKQIESVVTRVQTPTKSAPTPGWILGDCAGPQRGRGGPGRGFGSGMGRGGRRGMPPGWRGTGVNRWNPY